MDVFAAKIITFFGIELLHSMPMDCQQIKAKRVPFIVPATNLSPFAHEISSGETTKGGKFTEGSSSIFPSNSYPLIYFSIKFAIFIKHHHTL